VRELREFRAHHSEFAAIGVAVAGVSRDSPPVNAWWSRRMHLPYPVLSDRDGDAGRAIGIVRRVPIGPWTIDLVRRSTLLVDRDGRIAATWTDVHARGHALVVLEAARRLDGGAATAAHASVAG
jgi:peroxiredoxin Q/BCP